MPLPATEPLHLLIANATPLLPPGTPPSALPPLPPLPHLQALLGRLRLASTLEAGEDSLATPLELALAAAHGLPGAPGQLPWAAFETGTVGTPCAWFKPCHWQAGMDHLSLLDPAELALTEDESRALLAALQPLLRDDGLSLRYVAPDRWLAQGELLRGLATASMARALQRPLTPDALTQATDAAQGAHLRRLQSEIQMLLYPHPVNDAREQTQRWTVNALWIDGAGTLEAALPPTAQAHVEDRLPAQPTSTDELARVWQIIDAEILPPLLAAQRAGAPVSLTLCGPRRAITLTSTRGLVQKFLNKIRPLRLSSLREQL